MFRFVVLSAFLAIAAAAPSGHIAYAAAPVLHKTISYAHEPVITGYSTSVIKPNLEYSLATPVEHVQKHAVYAPARQLVEVQPEYHVEHAPVLTKVGAVVDHVPTAVSHQSSTVVHSKAAVVTPVVAPVAHKTIVPAQYAYAEPIYKTVVHSPHVYAAAPAHYHSW